MKTSKLLEFAKSNIKESMNGSTNTDDRFVCYAFEDQCNIHIRNSNEREKRITNFKHYVDQLLGGSPSLNYWLCDNNFISKNERDEAFGYEGITDEFIKIQNTRLAWMDWMIEQYAAIGD